MTIEAIKNRTIKFTTCYEVETPKGAIVFCQSASAAKEVQALILGHKNRNKF